MADAVSRTVGSAETAEGSASSRWASPVLRRQNRGSVARSDTFAAYRSHARTPCTTPRGFREQASHLHRASSAQAAPPACAALAES